ncbi:MAG: Cell division protein FtsZ [Parcubacteria group bacterium GW2011_GWB1_40_14]|nr:MAG: Cell division protein FtsZ [Parcubacteria group bacterium GW2011_GWB1_40_14]
MPSVKPQFESLARIKVVGVGGAGGKAVTRMVQSRLRGIEFVAINTDAQDLHHASANKKLLIGKNVTKGLGGGMDPLLGFQAADTSRDEIRDFVGNSDMVFITAGLGGATGSGAGPIVAEIAKETGALVVGVVTRPFSFEGVQRAKIAETAWENFSVNVDAIITIYNDRILNLIDQKTSVLGAFAFADDILRQAVKGIADLVATPGLINVDFADVKAIMQEAGTALIGIGQGIGATRAQDAARAAVDSALLDLSIQGAKRILFTISGTPDMTMQEINEAAKIITESIDPQAKVIFGAVVEDKTRRGPLRITLIASGFPGKEKSKPQGNLQIFRRENNHSQPIDVKNPKEVVVDEDAKDPFEVPAFIRRKNQ